MAGAAAGAAAAGAAGAGGGAAGAGFSSLFFVFFALPLPFLANAAAPPPPTQAASKSATSIHCQASNQEPDEPDPLELDCVLPLDPAWRESEFSESKGLEALLEADESQCAFAPSPHTG